MRPGSSNNPILWLAAIVVVGSCYGFEAFVAEQPADAARFRTAVRQFVDRCAPAFAHEASARSVKVALIALGLMGMLLCRRTSAARLALQLSPAQVAVGGAMAVCRRSVHRGGRHGP